MRILFLNITAQVGGAERSLLDLLASLRQFDPTLELILGLTADGPLVGLAEELRVKTQVLPMPAELLGLGDTALRGQGGWAVASQLLGRSAITGFALRRYLAQLRSLIRTTAPDVVHSNALKFHLPEVIPKVAVTAAPLDDGSVLVVGGSNPFCCGGLASAERYDPATRTWKAGCSPSATTPSTRLAPAGWDHRTIHVRSSTRSAA